MLFIGFSSLQKNPSYFFVTRLHSWYLKKIKVSFILSLAEMDVVLCESVIDVIAP